ncbi:hypothetical protein IIO94_000785 [Escherichia coli]|nr:hypothetical protein [Escherichia coli]
MCNINDRQQDRAIWYYMPATAHVDESIFGFISVVPVSGENLMKSHQL